MPIYEYECTDGHRFEELQKISDAPLTECKQCGKSVRKLVSQTAFSLKGNGWYQDGYASSSAVASKPATDNASTTTESSSSAKESKPTKDKKGDQA
ncbi:MAG: zinc ribbon domain-containing protein [Bdellovibrionota bacterium]